MAHNPNPPVINVATLPPRIRDLVIETAADYGIPVEALLRYNGQTVEGRAGWGRKGRHPRQCSNARGDLWWRCRQLVWANGKPPSWPTLGKLFGREHTSVLQCAQKFQRDLKTLEGQARLQQIYERRRSRHRIAAYEAGLIQEPPTERDLERAA